LNALLGLVFDTANVLDGEVLVITTSDDEGQEYLGRTGNRYQALDGGIEPNAIGFEVFDRDVFSSVLLSFIKA